MNQYLARAIRNPYSLLFFAPFILFAPVFLGGKALFWGTQITQFIPWWQQAVEIMQGGELPLWNQLNGMGAPLLANYQSALLYPPTWLLLLFGTLGGVSFLAWGLALILSLHLAWAAFGMARLVKALGWGMLAQMVSGLSFGLSGYLVARSHFPSIVFAAAWLPWVLHAAFELVTNAGRLHHVLRLGVCFGMLLLAGHAQTAWHIALLCAVWALYWSWNAQLPLPKIKVLLLFSSGLILGILLSFGQLLPTLEYLLESQRASEVDYEFAMAYSFWPWRFLTIFIPNLFGSPAAGNYTGYAAYWEDAVYIGLLPILLTVKAVFSKSLDITHRRLRYFLLTVSAVSFLLALGDNTPIYPWLYHNVPGFDMFQAPTRYSIWAVFSFCLLAGMGASSWKPPEGRSLYWSRLGIAGAAAISIGAGLALFLQQSVGGSFSGIPATYIPAVAMLSLWSVMAALMNLLVSNGKNDEATSFWAWALFSIILLDLLSVSWGLNPGVDSSLYRRSPNYGFDPEIGNPNGGRIFISSEDERILKFERFFSFETFDLDEEWENILATLLPNTNLLENIPSANNFDPLVPDRYNAWMTTLEDQSSPGRQAMLARMAVAWVEHPDENSPNGVWFEEIESEERIRWVPCAMVLGNVKDALQEIANAQLDPSQWIIQISENHEDEKSCDPDQHAKADLISEKANHLVVGVSADHDGWLVVSDIWYPGWQATMDGRSVEILVADTLFRSVQVPEGEHTVEFHYRPISFYLGMTVSLVSWFSVFWAWKRKR